MSENNGVKMVSSAILGKDTKVIYVGGRNYILRPPTIAQICGMAYYLSEVGDGGSLIEILRTINDMEKYTRALSIMIQGDEGLVEDLKRGTVDEVVLGLTQAYNLISIENFTMLSALKRSVGKMIAKQR